jgi:predicted DCC family thiol-disulfide oxidoreductase YuxK
MLRHEQAEEASGVRMIVVFDAQCLQCSGWVRFLLNRVKPDNLQILLELQHGRSWQNTAATLRVLERLAGWVAENRAGHCTDSLPLAPSIILRRCLSYDSTHSRGASLEVLIAH